MNHLLASLPIKGSGYEEFITALTQIAYAACEEGAQQMQAAGEIPRGLAVRRRRAASVYRCCHLGLAGAQSAIGGQVIDLDAAIRTARAELSAAKRNRDKDKAKELHSRIESLTNRQLVLRRVVDYIYFTLLNREAHRYKRFLLHREIQNIDPDVLKPALGFADARNRENPLKFTWVAIDRRHDDASRCFLRGVTAVAPDDADNCGAAFWAS